MLKEITFDLTIDLHRRCKLNSTIMGNIIRIAELHRGIRGQPILPTMAEEIRKDELIKSVGSTIGIEGNVLNAQEIDRAFKKADTNQVLTKMEAESVNSREVHRFILEWALNNPKGFIDEQLIRQIHTLTTRDIDYVGNSPGEYRDIPQSIGYPRRETILKTRLQVKNKIEEFISWLNGDHKDKPTRIPFVKAVMAHYYLTEIHPFGDGNGRTARAVEALILFKYGRINDYCFYGLPNYCYRERNRYIAELGKIYSTGDATSFVYFCTVGFIDNLSYIRNRMNIELSRLIFMDYIHQLRRQKKLNRRQVEFLQYLVDIGKIEYNDFMKRDIFGISDDSKRRYIKKLSGYQLITITEGENGIQIILPNFNVLRQIRLLVK